jgi:hypothetical protein
MRKEITMRQPIPVYDFTTRVFHLWDKHGLLTVGDPAAGQYNTMTVSWGAMGAGAAIRTGVVRPTLHSSSWSVRHLYLERFPERYWGARPIGHKQFMA